MANYLTITSFRKDIHEIELKASGSQSSFKTKLPRNLLALTQIPCYNFHHSAPLVTLTCKHSSELDVLYINDQFVQQMPGNVFLFCANLCKLTLCNDGIEQLAPKAFNGLKSLVELSVSYNKIASIGQFLFDDLESLEVLELNDNRISSIHSDAFKRLVKLKKLNLEHNSLETIAGDAFSTCRSLKLFYLDKHVKVAKMFSK